MTFDPGAVSAISTKADLVRFIETLCADLRANPTEWENRTLETFLEALGSWIDGSDNFFVNTGRPVPKDVDWRFLAMTLAAARLYE